MTIPFSLAELRCIALRLALRYYLTLRCVMLETGISKSEAEIGNRERLAESIDSSARVLINITCRLSATLELP